MCIFIEVSPILHDPSWRPVITRNHPTRTWTASSNTNINTLIIILPPPSVAMILHQVLQLGLAAAALASPLASRGQDKGSGITWGSCPFADKVPGPIECGTLKVPLDYTNPESGDMVELKLSKVPASNGPSKGSILFNFGGPGYEAIMTLGVIKPQLLE
jgi:hypothetical protein